jgi:hypothetical protein
LPIIPSNTSNLFIDEQQATGVAVKRKKDDATIMAQLPRSESRRLSWLPHVKPWIRSMHASVPPPLFGRRRR